MLNLPAWIIDILKTDKFTCPHCKSAFNPNDIRACGVRLSFRNIKKHVLYVEYHCSKCSKRAGKRPPTLLEIQEMSFEEFAFSIIDDPSDEEETYDKKQKKQKKPGRKLRSRSKITDQEIAGVRKLLERSDSHYDFLVGLGMTPKELQHFNIKKQKNDKNK
tara:strand:+ start:542 stop:1024 length:483 start_codon:yes stop_codon:yes gene_type:complete